jgi:hypothetical protein
LLEGGNADYPTGTVGLGVFYDFKIKIKNKEPSSLKTGRTGRGLQGLLSGLAVLSYAQFAVYHTPRHLNRLANTPLSGNSGCRSRRCPGVFGSGIPCTIGYPENYHNYRGNFTPRGSSTRSNN